MTKINTKHYDIDELQRRREIADSLFQGRAGSVTFIKANGERRKMSVMTKVKKHLKGGQKTFNEVKDPHLYGCYDTNAKSDDRRGGYRCFNLASVLEMKGKGETLTFDNISGIEER